MLGLSYKNLRILRNEIFARKGYRFSSFDLTEHFTKYNWYKPEYNKSEISGLLSETDKFNIRIISNYEKDFQNGFMSYVSTIPIVDLPMNFDCSKGFEPRSSQIEESISIKYRHNRGTLIGKLFEQNSRIGIIYGYPADIFLPILIIFNERGEELESKQVLESLDCAGDEGFYTSAQGTISQDLEIQVTRTTLQRDLSIENSKFDTTYIERKYIIR